MQRVLTASTVTADPLQSTPTPENDKLSLLAVAFVVGHWLSRRRVAWLSEAGFALLLGVAVGCGVKFFTNSATFAHWISFKKDFFFIALLPPIIFDAGFSLKVKPFFQNIGAIAAYAFIGTTVSTFVIGLIIWVAGWRISAPLTFLEASLYGAIVSATDPVTVLAIFHRLHVDENLYALVFGESVLNDAVAIVLYGTLTIFLDQPATLHACVRAAGTFVAIFAGSMVIGVGFALLASLAVKSKYFRSDDTPLESILVVLFAYGSYMLADGLKLSGIVAILFCGMVMAHYTRPSLSRVARDRTTAFVKTLATLAETFVFIYIGLSLFLEQQAWDRGLTWAFLAISLVALAISRAVNVYPCTALVNALRTAETRVPPRHSFMLWFSGLRGAMAFALSLQAAEDLPAGAGRVILTSTFFIVLITVLVNGGCTTYLVDALGLKQRQGYLALLHEEGRQPHRNSPESSPAGSITSSRHMDAAPLFLGEPPTGFEGLGAGPVGLAQPNGTWPIRAASPPAGHEQGFLRSGLTKVREANKSGFVLSKLEGLDKRFGKHFMPSEQSDDVELVVVEGAVPGGGNGGGGAAPSTTTQHHTTTVSATPQEPAPAEDSPKQPPPWLL